VAGSPFVARLNRCWWRILASSMRSCDLSAFGLPMGSTDFQPSLTQLREGLPWPSPRTTNRPSCATD